MILHNLHIVSTGKTENIAIHEGRIAGVAQTSGTHLHFDKAIAFPGLINSHDHLDFDLFPRIGNRTYNNYAEWGADIHLHNKALIDSILKIPVSLRIKWGIYKNLLCGVTTVVNHGNLPGIPTDLINIFERSQSIHSLQGEKFWKIAVNKPYKRTLPIAIHIGEGTDKMAHQEIDQLLKWNFLKRRIIGIHGVAMDEQQAKNVEALVWCPDSNYFLYGKTADIERLRQQTTILLGTDSTLTASWNIWDHLRFARDQNVIEDRELFDMVTSTAAQTWRIPDTGELKNGYWADLVVAKQAADDDFFSLQPADILLVLVKGKIMMFDATLATAPGISMVQYSKIYIDNVCKYVYGNVGQLLEDIHQYNPTIEFPISINEQ
jgi:cytosine/adenosine deaminase-related metal-dependent hydrolase